MKLIDVHIIMSDQLKPVSAARSVREENDDVIADVIKKDQHRMFYLNYISDVCLHLPSKTHTYCHHHASWHTLIFAHTICLTIPSVILVHSFFNI